VRSADVEAGVSKTSCLFFSEINRWLDVTFAENRGGQQFETVLGMTDVTVHGFQWRHVSGTPLRGVEATWCVLLAGLG